MQRTRKRQGNSHITPTAERVIFRALTGFLVLFTAGIPDQFALAQEDKIGPVVKPSDSELIAPVWGLEKAADAPDELSFKSLDIKLGGSKVQLSGGVVVVDLADWRAIAVSDNSKGNMCSLTLIGPRTVLLAAHCVDANIKTPSKEAPVLAASVQFSTSPHPFKMKCEISSEYSRWPLNEWGTPRTAEDYALCELDRPVKDIDYETLSMNEDITVGDAITLVGHGCVSLGISEDAKRYTYKEGNRILRIGERPVEAQKVSLFASRPALYWRTLSSNGSEPALCYGDSGGPVLYPKPEGGRRVVALNSALGFVPDATPANPAFFSYLSPLNTDEFKRFLSQWVAAGAGGSQDPRKVCGLNVKGGIQGCRQ
ncbi:trypsin-like serine peptidase [Pseudomonas sp. NPDC087639]|uniref:trypsin-like serine peptidase n=1 Tax=Pseudomonas sp. NPDC087639 TaxID=3364445 RepID=UPI0037FA8922